MLAAAGAVLTTSRWTRCLLLERHGLRPDRVHVAEPGADAAGLARGTRTGGRLLCVAAVTRNKGHDLLATALAGMADLPWRCSLVGSLTRDPAYVARVRRQVERDGLVDRVAFRGPLHGDALAASYAAADLLVLPTRLESYGMVVTEALARGVPVVATDRGRRPGGAGHAAGRPAARAARAARRRRRAGRGAAALADRRGPALRAAGGRAGPAAPASPAGRRPPSGSPACCPGWPR